MDLPGRDRTVELPDGRTVPVLDAGDPAGRPVFLHHGTPSGRWQAALIQGPATAAGVRLVSFNRPGYGAAPMTPPSLASVGADTVAVADALGIDRFAVLGISGGGPYALATGLAGHERAIHLGVVAGIGPWRLIDPVDSEPAERQLLARVDEGDVEGALEGYRRLISEDHGTMLALPDDAMVDAFFDGAPAADLDWLDAEAKRIWAVDLRDALRSYDGYARDNVAWGADWDIDPAGLSSPVTLWYGDDDRMVTPAHGEWHAARIPHARLVVRAGAGHGTTSFGYADDIFATLSRPGR